MAKATAGGATPKKKEPKGYAYKFKGAMEKPLARGEGYRPAMLRRYHDEIAPALMKEFGYTNRLQLPVVDKVVCNIGLGEAIKTPKILEQTFESLGNITGQRPVVTRASAFSMRPSGCLPRMACSRLRCATSGRRRTRTRARSTSTSRRRRT